MYGYATLCTLDSRLLGLGLVRVSVSVRVSVRSVCLC